MSDQLFYVSNEIIANGFKRSEDENLQLFRNKIKNKNAENYFLPLIAAYPGMEMSVCFL